MVRVGHSNKKVAKIPRYPEGQMDKEKNFCPAIARIVTLVDHKVLLPLKYYLNMSCVQWQLNGLKKHEPVIWFAFEDWRNFGDPEKLDDFF